MLNSKLIIEDDAGNPISFIRTSPAIGTAEYISAAITTNTRAADRILFRTSQKGSRMVPESFQTIYNIKRELSLPVGSLGKHTLASVDLTVRLPHGADTIIQEMLGQIYGLVFDLTGAMTTTGGSTPPAVDPKFIQALLLGEV